MDDANTYLLFSRFRMLKVCGHGGFPPGHLREITAELMRLPQRGGDPTHHRRIGQGHDVARSHACAVTEWR
jgi:hypothetical protein